MNLRTKYTIEWMQHNYKISLLEEFESETEIIISDEIEKCVPEIFLAECIASLANKIKNGDKRIVREAQAVFTYEERLDIQFKYFNIDNPILFVMENEILKTSLKMMVCNKV